MSTTNDHFRFRKYVRANSAVDNAYIDAQKIGKVPELCSAESSFNTHYSSCQACVATNSANDTATQQVDLNPTFGEYIEYCSSVSASESSSSAIPATSTADISVSSLPNITTSTSFSTPSTTYGSAYSTITILHTQSIPLFNGSIVTYTFTDSVTLEDQPTSSTTLSNLQPKSSSHKVALIAGILAPIGSLMLLGFCFFILRRYSRSHKFGIWRHTATNNPDGDTGQEKAQLHSDSLPLKSPKEMEGLSRGPIAELQAVEPVAIELPGVHERMER
ncbi:glyco X protein [Rutstroemia sp. NJR-2017a BVV2]|nr:glyco X protein [Rutstroemia sp. NJR-2017a BVV2]